MSGSGQYLEGPYVTLQHTLAVMSLLEKKKKKVEGLRKTLNAARKFRIAEVVHPACVCL